MPTSDCGDARLPTMAKEKTVGSNKREAAARTRKLRRKASETARDQFASLGLFIQNFENVVNALRNDCAHIVQGRNRGLSGGNPKVFVMSSNIASLVFHHENMSAKPILDVWKALMAEECRALCILERLSKKGDETTKAIVKEISAEFRVIYEARNSLVHATWSIGYWFKENDFDTLNLKKWKVSGDGFQQRIDLPTSFDEIVALAKRANKLWGKLGRLSQFFYYHPEAIENVFVKSGKEWIFVPP
jgi:hypothetical protein